VIRFIYSGAWVLEEEMSNSCSFKYINLFNEIMYRGIWI